MSLQLIVVGTRHCRVLYIIPVQPELILHIKICEYLVYKLQRYLAEHNLELVAKTGLGVRTEEDKSRSPDVVVCTQSLLERAGARPGAGILDFDEKPLLYQFFMRLHRIRSPWRPP